MEQSKDLSDEDEVRAAHNTAMQQVLNDQKQYTKDVKDRQTEEMQRKLAQTSEPGASSWVGALPLTQFGYNLSRGEFQDALALQYNTALKNLPTQCPCGKTFSTTHTLNCTKGGFVNARHDMLRDFEAQLLKSVCNDVETESLLQPVNNNTNFNRSAIVSEEARLDVRARGFWRTGQNAFFDVRVTNETSESQRNYTVESILQKHEKEKKRE